MTSRKKRDKQMSGKFILKSLVALVRDPGVLGLIDVYRLN